MNRPCGFGNLHIWSLFVYNLERLYCLFLLRLVSAEDKGLFYPYWISFFVFFLNLFVL